MTNGAQYHLVLKLNELAENNGFVVKRNYQGHCESALMLCNKKDKFPHYVADSEFVIGTVEDLYNWLTGWEKALQYTELLGLSAERRAAQEQLEHNTQLMKILSIKEQQ